MWKRALFAVLPVAVLLILPFALRPSAPKGTANTVTQEAEKLVIVTPHTEQIRYEFDRAFRLYYQKKYGKDVKIDWRNVGGTSDIVRYIADRFEAAFRLEYEKSGKEWTNEVSKNYKNYRVDPAKCEERRMFLNSSCGIGIDIFFGGGYTATFPFPTGTVCRLLRRLLVSAAGRQTAQFLQGFPSIFHTGGSTV